MWTCDSTFVHIDKATDNLVMEPWWRVLWDLRPAAARKDRPFEVTRRGCTSRAAARGGAVAGLSCILPPELLFALQQDNVVPHNSND